MLVKRSHVATSRPRPSPSPAGPLPACSKYVDSTLDYCKRNFKHVVQLPAINQVQTLCSVGDEAGPA